jgi:hypothetical protein
LFSGYRATFLEVLDGNSQDFRSARKERWVDSREEWGQAFG